MNDAVLRVEGLSKSFGGIDAVRDVSFAVAAGELVALIGPNGAGKTTCFNSINGQLAPDAGTVTLSGARIDGLPPRGDRRHGRGPHVPGRRDVRVDDRARKRRSSRCWRMPERDRGVGARATDCMRVEADALLERVRMRDWRTTDARRSPTATRSASSWRWRSPASRDCC